MKEELFFSKNHLVKILLSQPMAMKIAIESGINGLIKILSGIHRMSETGSDSECLETSQAGMTDKLLQNLKQR